MYSDGNSFEQILDRTLNNELLIDMDKREGSVVYNTLAPLCLELADAYAKLDILEGQLSLLTATGENLDNRAYEQGIAREQATQAERTATFKKYQIDEQTGEYVRDEFGNRILIDMDIPEGSRFVSPDNDLIIYEFIGKNDDNENILRCETYGSVGNEYVGTILPLIAIPDLVTSIPNGAFFLSGLETIELPKNLSRIEASAFCRCYNLKEINIPDSVTFIGHDAFSQCFELNEVHISKNTDTIEYGAFWKCSSLKSIVIPDSVESLESVTFQHCNDLSSITLPNSLKKIDHHNFSGCNNLKDVYFNGTEEEWKKIAIKDNNDPLISANIHYQG